MASEAVATVAIIQLDQVDLARSRRSRSKVTVPAPLNSK